MSSRGLSTSVKRRSCRLREEEETVCAHNARDADKWKRNNTLTHLKPIRSARALCVCVCERCARNGVLLWRGRIIFGLREDIWFFFFFFRLLSIPFPRRLARALHALRIPNFTVSRVHLRTHARRRRHIRFYCNKCRAFTFFPFFFLLFTFVSSAWIPPIRATDSRLMCERVKPSPLDNGSRPLGPWNVRGSHTAVTGGKQRRWLRRRTRRPPVLVVARCAAHCRVYYNIISPPPQNSSSHIVYRLLNFPRPVSGTHGLVTASVFAARYTSQAEFQKRREEMRIFFFFLCCSNRPSRWNPPRRRSFSRLFRRPARRAVIINR